MGFNLGKAVTNVVKKTTGIDFGRPTAGNAAKRQAGYFADAERDVKKLEAQELKPSINPLESVVNKQAPAKPVKPNTSGMNFMAAVQAQGKYNQDMKAYEQAMAEHQRQMAAPRVSDINATYDTALGGDKTQAAAPRRAFMTALAGEYGAGGFNADGTQLQGDYTAGGFQAPTDARIAGPVGAGGFQDTRMMGDRSQATEALRSAMAGEAPSAAQSMLQQGTEQAIKQQAAQLAANPNINPALAAKMAQQSAVDMQANAGQQAAQLRAQEMAQARGMFADSVQGFGAQDLQAAQAELGGRQFDAGQSLAAQQFNAQQSMAEAGQDLAARQFNAGQTLSADSLNAQQAMEAARQDLGARQFNAGQAMSQDQFNATQANQAALQQQQLEQQTAAQNAANRLSAGQSYLDLVSNRDSQILQQNQLQEQLARQDRSFQIGLDQQNMDNVFRRAAATAGDFQAATAGSNQMAGAMMQGGSALMSTFMSDAAAKGNIKSNKKELAQFLSSIKPKSFNYTAPEAGEDPEERFDGFMAQDIEKSTIGKNLVAELGGYKQINAKKALMATMASVGYLNEKLKKLEKK